MHIKWKHSSIYKIAHVCDLEQRSIYLYHLDLYLYCKLPWHRWAKGIDTVESKLSMDCSVSFSANGRASNAMVSLETGETQVFFFSQIPQTVIKISDQDAVFLVVHT